MAKRIPKQIRFSVVGTGTFPFDMLRYDACWPESEARDSSAIAASALPGAPPPEGGWRVALRSKQESVCRNGPTEGRWRSFGWRVVDGSVEEAV